jgi:hypothetical protein
MLRTASALLAGAGMIVCLAAPVLHFQGALIMADYKTAFALASLCWFVGATAFISCGKR